jgi:hypothetical protein
MVTINRCAIVVQPAQPFLDWLHRVDPSSAHLGLRDLRLEPTIYLLPECENREEAIGYLSEVCSEIFEEQLDGTIHGFPRRGSSLSNTMQIKAPEQPRSNSCESSWRRT